MWRRVASVDLDRSGPIEKEDQSRPWKEERVLVSRSVTITASKLPAFPAAKTLSSTSFKPEQAIPKPGLVGLARTSAPFVPHSQQGEPNRAMEEPGRTQTAEEVEERPEEPQEELPLYLKQSYAEQLGKVDEGRGKKKKGRR